MALQKTVATNKGVSLAYHRLAQINVDFTTGNAQAAILSYTNKLTRDKDINGFIASIGVRLPAQIVREVNSSPVLEDFFNARTTGRIDDEAYRCLKLMDEWKDATNV